MLRDLCHPIQPGQSCVVLDTECRATLLPAFSLHGLVKKQRIVLR